uniref:C2H2-type domain-containing protein n=1 Tax=Caenorhabditis japonica TaxID=281687 RepID=A0A8R1DPL6_CAEJA
MISAEEPTSSEADNLRRSKRKKFRLDVVAAAHGNNQKKSRRDPHEEVDSDVDDFSLELSVDTEVDKSAVTEDKGEDYEDDTLSKRRTRRSTAHWGDYQENYGDWVEQSGSFACTKCPSRYESRSSLSNHTKMHTEEKRKFPCELCDFSANTQKSLMSHNNIHKRYGVVSAQTSPAIAPVEKAATAQNNNNSNAPQLIAAVQEPYVLKAESDPENEEDDGTPPPVLEREVSASPPLLQIEKATCTEPKETIREVEAPKIAPARKSNRTIKPKKDAAYSSPKKVTKRSKTPTQKKLKVSPTTAAVKPSLLLPFPKQNGSLPRSSSSSSGTPPGKRSPELSKTPPKNQDKQVQKKRMRRCPHCPFRASSITLLNRHTGGHRIKEGYLCPAENCNYMCKSSAFLKKHLKLHNGKLRWPPTFVKKEEKSAEEKRKSKFRRTMLIKKAQIRSHKIVSVENNIVLKRCNIGTCTFQTVSITQLIAHKAKAHRSKIVSKNPFLCFTCGHRTKTYAELRVHKLTRHISPSPRFHRTFYLKEIVGEKFFINYYLSYAEEECESDDDSFDSVAGGHVPAALAALQKPAFFCCNMCPYQAPTMNRCQRHHAKHFTESQFQCRYCSWSARNEEVLANHEKLHEPAKTALSAEPVTVEKEESGQSTSSADANETQEELPEAKAKAGPPVREYQMFACKDTLALARSLKTWCRKEKILHPEMNDQFIRRMIDGVKGFQCLDCPYISKYRGDMRSHKKRHDEDQMFRCVQCTYTTNRPVSLKDHMKQHVPANEELKDVKARNVIVNHGINIGSRNGCGRSRIYCCNKCPYVTSAIGCLWRHHRNHRSTAKFYICSNCTYSSIENRKMEEHTVIHTALGINETMPFVKRVDYQGNPVSSLTDFNSDKVDRKFKRKLVEEDKKEKEASSTPQKKRKRSNESTPISESPGPAPVRQLSDRTTRSRHNYSLMAKNGSGRPTPIPSFLDSQKLKKDETVSNEEPIEVSHWKIRNFLNAEFNSKESHKCPECPFLTSSSDVLKQHLFFHEPPSSPRPYNCCDCSFTSLTPAAILQHLKLHSDGVIYDPMLKKMMKARMNDTIPKGSKGFVCNLCGYKTLTQQFYIEHRAYHRQQMAKRINISMKRAPPKEEYQRPKLKHQFIARNAKYCKKCTFKCISQSNFIEHVDRHGWNQLYKCHTCDYSDNNKSVVLFHQLNHHIIKDQSLQSVNAAAEFRLENGVIQKPESDRPKPTPEEFAKKSRGLLKCACCEYFCHVPSELAFHMSVKHRDEPDARETISYLHMGLLPPQASVKTI